MSPPLDAMRAARALDDSLVLANVSRRRFVQRSEAEAMLAAGELRKLPDREGTIRLIDIADCDRNAANDCEAVLADDSLNCGVCGVQCAAPNAETACLGGTCRVISCTAGHCDADGEPANGCEVEAKSCHP